MTWVCLFYPSPVQPPAEPVKNCRRCTLPFAAAGELCPTCRRTPACPVAGPQCKTWAIRMSSGEVFVPCVHGSCLLIERTSRELTERLKQMCVKCGTGTIAWCIDPNRHEIRGNEMTCRGDDPRCGRPADGHTHRYLSMADRIPNGEPMNDALAEAQRLQKLPRCGFPGCQAVFDLTIKREPGPRNNPPGVTGWRWLPGDPEDQAAGPHDHGTQRWYDAMEEYRRDMALEPRGDKDYAILELAYVAEAAMEHIRLSAPMPGIFDEAMTSKVTYYRAFHQLKGLQP